MKTAAKEPLPMNERSLMSPSRSSGRHSCRLDWHSVCELLSFRLCDAVVAPVPSCSAGGTATGAGSTTVAANVSLSSGEPESGGGVLLAPPADALLALGRGNASAAAAAKGPCPGADDDSPMSPEGVLLVVKVEEPTLSASGLSGVVPVVVVVGGEGEEDAAFGGCCAAAGAGEATSCGPSPAEDLKHAKKPPIPPPPLAASWASSSAATPPPPSLCVCRQSAPLRPRPERPGLLPPSRNSLPMLPQTSDQATLRCVPP